MQIKKFLNLKKKHNQELNPGFSKTEFSIPPMFYTRMLFFIFPDPCDLFCFNLKIKRLQGILFIKTIFYKIQCLNNNLFTLNDYI